MTTRVRGWVTAAGFLLPAVAIMAVFIVYPAVTTLALSFFDAEGHWVGARNFVAFLSDEETLDLARFPVRSPPWGSLIHNALWIAIHLPLTVVLGIVFAAMLYRLRGGPVIKAIIFVGMVVPMIVGGVIIRFLFDENAGLVPLAMRALGADLLGRSWTAYPQTALAALIIGSVFLWTGFSLAMHAAGLATIPRSVLEAAEVDGAGPVRRFVSITVPLLAPVTSVVVAMTLLYEIKIFDIVYAATVGGPGGASMVLSLQMYFAAFRRLDRNAAATVATVLTFFTAAIGIWLARRNLRELNR
jgi:multiple sugar transport system permease protein